MIKGIGTDIADLKRMANAVEREAFLTRVFTPEEIAYCESKMKGKTASYAGRFAAKEAIMKALGIGLREGRLVDIEIVNDELGAPVASLTGGFAVRAEALGVKKIWISISHSQEYATAQCVLEG